MGFKYAIRSERSHFLTHTIIGWADLFTRKELAQIIIDSLNFCIANKGLEVNAWCLMPSHLHMIATSNKDGTSLSDIMRDFKKFSSKEIIDAIQTIGESRKEWLLKLFGRGENAFQVWQEGMHPEELYSRDFTRQKLDYIHNNPVVAGFVYEPQHYVYSSAIDYYTGQKGLVKVVLI